MPQLQSSTLEAFRSLDETAQRAALGRMSDEAKRVLLDEIRSVGSSRSSHGASGSWEEPAPPEETGVIAAVKRTGKNLINLPGAVYHAVTDPPRNDEERIISGAGIPGANVTGSGAIGLAVNRLWADPVRAKAAEINSAEGPGTTAVRIGKTAVSAVPGVGPFAVDLAERAIEKGDVSGAATEAALNFGLPAAISKLKPGMKILPKLETENPVTQAAVEFGRREGIPIDAATATGNKAIAGAQQVIEHSPVGGVVSQARRLQQTRSIVATGQRLADEVHPSPVTPEQAGAGVVDTLTQKSDAATAARLTTYEQSRDAAMNRAYPRAVSPEEAGSGLRDSMTGKISNIKQFEDEAYGKFRDIANAPENMREVQVGTQSAKMKSAFDDLVGQSVDSRLHGIKEIVRGGATEMTGKLKREYVNPDNPHDVGKISGRFGGGFKDMFPELKNFPESPGEMAAAIEKGGSNPLYQRLRKAMRDTVIEEEGGEIRDALRTAGLEDGAQNIREVPITKEMALPVDMRPIKSQLKPMFDQMQTWMEPAKRNASAGFQAIKSIVEGPNYIPAEVAEQGLGGLKSLAREAKSPDLRNVNAGLGANAAKQLQALIDQTVSSAGPDAIDALRAGRMAHAAKMGTAEVLGAIREEPVQAFSQTVWAHDAGIDQLRQVAKEAPQQMAQIGRAYLDEMFKDVRSDDAKTAARAAKQWSNLGLETKKILFNQTGQVKQIDSLVARAQKLTQPAQVTQVLESLKAEPVQAFNQAVWAQDAGIEKLRQVAKLAPNEMPKIGRAFIDKLLERATAEGGFDKEKGVLGEWQNLGPETKRILFRNPLLIRDLDNFFMLAKKIAERPNTSNTAVVGAMVAGIGWVWTNPVTGITAMIGSSALAEMMYSPRAVRALTNGMRVSLGNKTAAALAASQILAVAGDKAQQLPAATGQ